MGEDEPDLVALEVLLDELVHEVELLVQVRVGLEEDQSAVRPAIRHISLRTKGEEKRGTDQME